MATQLQIRRGTTAQMNAFTGAEGELAVNTSTDTVHVHDGATAGGFALAKADGSNIGTYAGSFTTISASGAITGNVTGNLTGSVLTAAQTNITSVGTLSALTVTGEITANGGIALGDGDVATFGASDDLQIYHDGNHSYIEDAGTGSIKIKVGDFRVENASGNNLIKGVGDVATLHHAGSEKLATTSTGIDVTGTATATTLTATNGVLNLDDNGSHNGVINVPASLFINIDSDNGATGEDFVIAKDRTGTSGGTELFRVQEDGIVDIGGVGNISPYGIRFAINGTGTGGAGLYFGSGVIIPTDNTPTITDANVDLGASNYRFKDLYLSGNASMAGLSPGIVTISSASYFIGNTSSGYRFNNAADTSNLMILKDDGNLLVGKTVAINSCHTFYKNQANNTAVFENANGVTPFGVQVRFSGADPNSTSAYMFSGYGYNGSSLITRFAVMSNGGIRNYQTNNVDLSDERVKTDIQPLGSMWDKLKGIEIVGFKYTDQTHERSNIGVIAQQVQSVAPEFVDDSSWDDERFDEPLKSVFSNDLHNATIKALQEAMDRIETLEAKVQELENN